MDDPKAQPFYSCIHNIKVIQPVAIWLAWGCSRQAMRCFLGNCPLVEGGRDTVFHLRRRVLYKSLWLSTSRSFITCTLFGCLVVPPDSVVYRPSPGLRKSRDIFKQRVDVLYRKIALYTAGFPCQPYSCLHSHSEMLNDGNAQQLWRCLDNIATIKPKTAILENVLGFARVIDDVMKKIDGSARVRSNKAVLQRHFFKGRRGVRRVCAWGPWLPFAAQIQFDFTQVKLLKRLA